MEKIPTAKELAKDKVPKGYRVDDFLVDNDIYELMRDYAKLHVEAALEAAKNIVAKDRLSKYGLALDCEDKVLSAYPLTNIK